MNAELLTVAKNVSVWALAIIAVYFIAETVLKGDTASVRFWYLKLGAGLMFAE